MYVHLTCVWREVEAEAILGPFQDVQITSNVLRDEDGRGIARLLTGAWYIEWEMFQKEKVIDYRSEEDENPQDQRFSDIIFSETEPLIYHD